jgi:hypothetical protein
MSAADFTSLTTGITSIIALAVAGGVGVFAAMSAPRIGLKVYHMFMK